jgi:hypothetical protein
MPFLKKLELSNCRNQNTLVDTDGAVAGVPDSTARA